MSLSCSFNSFMHRSSRLFNIDLAILAGNLVDYSVLFFWIDSALGRTRCDLSVVSDQEILIIFLVGSKNCSYALLLKATAKSL